MIDKMGMRSTLILTMKSMREQLTFTMLFILFASGFIAQEVNGLCYRPSFTNPYAITLEPDKDTYGSERVELGCEVGHTPFGLPDTIYCSPASGWDPDPSAGLCCAQCNTTELIQDDDIKAIDENNEQQTIFNHGEEASFECTDKGQFAGSDRGMCDNGTLIVTADYPTCLAYCPVTIDEEGMIGDGLYYETDEAPVTNETTTVYYRTDDVITYRCLDGYDGPHNCSSPDCRSTCDDGSWNPDSPEIPLCVEINECSDIPCQNNATCVDMINGYICQCAQGCSGTNYDIEITTMMMTTKSFTTTDTTTSDVPTVITDASTTTSDVSTVISDASTTTTDVSTVITDAPTTTLDVSTVITDVSTTTSDVPTVITDASTTTSDVSTVITDLSTTTSDVSTVFTDASTTTSDVSTVITDASTTTSDVSTVITDATTTTSDMSTVITDASTTTSDVSTVITDASTNTSDASTTTSDASTVISDASTTTSDVSTDITDASTATSGATVLTSDVTTTSHNATTATSHIPTVTQDTTLSPTTVPEATSSTTSLPETTEANPVQSTTPDAQEATSLPTTKPTTPRITEKPRTTPLPCKGECQPTQECNIRNNTCECRQRYYEDETDAETPCREPTSFDVTITITEVNGSAAIFTKELKNSTSDEFKELASDVCQPLNEIYGNNTEYVGCQVLKFSEGSIIVNYILKFAENSTTNTSTVYQTIQDELSKSDGAFAGDLTYNSSSLVVEPLNECNKGIDDCDDENAICYDLGRKGYICVCVIGYQDKPGSLPGRDCIKTTTEPQPTEPQETEPQTCQTTKPKTTEEPDEAGLEPWKVIVGVTVPIVGILTISIIGLTCWWYRRQHRTSPSPSTNMKTYRYDDDYEDDERYSSDRESGRPGNMMIMNSDGTVQEVGLPWLSYVPEAEPVLVQDSNKRQTQMLTMIDYPNDYSGSSSEENYPMRNIHSLHDSYTYEHHDTRGNTTEIDAAKYF